MTTRKYEFVIDDTILVNDVALTRIRALIDIPGICKVGDLGGYIEKEENLNHAGKCWVAYIARVYGDAQVFGSSWVADDAQVCGRVQIYGDARVFGSSRISGNAAIYGNAQVAGDAQVSGNAQVAGDAQVSGDARIFGDVCVSGNAKIDSDAEVSEKHHVVWFCNVGSENGTLTVFRSKDGVKVTRGCFSGTPEEFLAASKEKHNTRIHEEYKSLISVGVSRITY